MYTSQTRETGEKGDTQASPVSQESSALNIYILKKIVRNISRSSVSWFPLGPAPPIATASPLIFDHSQKNILQSKAFTL